MIDIRKVLFLVDGITEVKSIKAKFQKEYHAEPGFRIINCNGKNVSASGYTNKAVPAIMVGLSQQYEKIICIVDREQRKKSAIQFQNAVYKEIKTALLKSKSISEENFTNSISVCVPDKMFENWIVADVEGIKVRKNLILNDANQDYFDGRSGTTVLEQMMKIPYKKTQHAELLFKAVDFLRAINFSPSFSSFCSELNN